MIKTINWIVKGLITITFGCLVYLCLSILALLFWNDRYLLIANYVIDEIWDK